MKQNKKPKQTLESAQYGLEINFKIAEIANIFEKMNKWINRIMNIE